MALTPRKWPSQLFQDKWGVEKWGDIHTFLGMRCKYDRSTGVLTFDVEQKIKDMLKAFSIIS